MQLPDRVVVYEIDSEDYNDMMYHQKVSCDDVIYNDVINSDIISNDVYVYVNCFDM